MTHDPLCPLGQTNPQPYYGINYCECDLIARVREDERARAAVDCEKQQQKSYREGYNAHAAGVRHWQATHGAYRVPPPPPDKTEDKA